MVGAMALAKGLSENLQRPSFPHPQLLLLLLPVPSPKLLKPLSVSAVPSSAGGLDPLVGLCRTASNDLKTGRMPNIPGLEVAGKIKQPKKFILFAGISST